MERRLRDASEMQDLNKYMIEWHEKEKQRSVEIGRMELQYRHTREEEMRKEDEKRRVEDKLGQKIYGDTLEFQRGISNRQKMCFGSMTEVEKKMNKLDLKSYKEGETTLHSMIPGIHNL